MRARALTLLRRQHAPFPLRALCFTAGIAAGLLVSCTVLVAAGVPAKAIASEFIGHVFFTSRGLAHATTLATPLILVGLGAAAAVKLRFWNIGVEGQLWCGALAATGVAIFDIGPEPLRLPLMLAVAMLAGAAWIGVPAFFKLRYRVNEIIMTLLMTYVAFLLVQHLLFGAWQDPSVTFPVSPRFDDAERLARLGWGKTHSGIIVTLLAGLAMWVLMERSRFGFYADATGNNPTAARAAGIPVVMTIAGAALVSGGLSGLAGAIIVSGTEFRLTQFLGHGYTFSAIVIAFVARFRPLQVVVAGFVLAGIYTAGETLKVFYSVSEAVVVLIEGSILLSLLLSRFFSTYHVRMAEGAAEK